MLEMSASWAEPRCPQESHLLSLGGSLGVERVHGQCVGSLVDPAHTCMVRTGEAGCVDGDGWQWNREEGEKKGGGEKRG